MAFVGGMGQGRGPMRMEGEVNVISKFTNDGVCGCAPIKFSTKKTKYMLLKERIRQFSIWYFETEDQREIEHVKVRRERKKKQKNIDKLSWMRSLRYLYIADAIVWTAGIVLTFCSTVEEIGRNTPFYIQRQKYKIIGPLVLLVGVILLLVASGIKHKYMKNVKELKHTKFFIKQSKRSKEKAGLQSIKTDRLLIEKV